MVLHHERRGSGEPLLLIQGMSGHTLHWGEAFLSALEPHFDVIANDHRNPGLSPRVEGSYTLGDLAEDAVEKLEQLGIESAHVMGISMGGMVAQEVALAAPSRVRSLTLGCTYAGGAGSRLTEDSVRQRMVAAAMAGDRELMLRTGWEINVSTDFAAAPGNFETFREMATQVPVALPVLFEQLGAVMGHDTSARLASLTVPTLVIHGDADQVLGVENGRHIAGLVPGARLEILEGAGHMFWWEMPDRSAALVREHVLAHVPA
jgi:pimeloyl-ACP methyl ester carboxylesterase